MSELAQHPDTGPKTLDALYDEAKRLDVTPGWIPRATPILWKEPKSAFVPHRWRYADIRAALAAAGSLIDVKLAERRNLVLRNPVPDNNFATTRTLVCAYQMILPGETAPSHRHAPHAMRLILDAKGAYSIVNGEKTPMETGDVVLTPGNFWHGHGHDGADTAYWWDGRDVPLTHLLEPMFYEEHPDRYEKIVATPAASPFRFTRAAMDRDLDRSWADNEGRYGPRIRLDTPDMPSMGLYMARLSSGQRTRSWRSTANRIFVSTDGSGETRIGGATFAWRRGDTFVVPAWTDFSHRADTDTTLFEFTDEPLMRFMHYYREEMG